MPPPTDPVLQSIAKLDRSSPNFGNQLDAILHGQKYFQCMPHLENDDLAWFIEYLDEAIGILGPLTDASRKCLRELKTICRDKGKLPSSYLIPYTLLNLDDVALAPGGFGDVYQGTFNGSMICAKHLTTYKLDNPGKADKMFCGEAVMWKYLDHPNIVPLLGVTLSPHWLISNWMSGGDLADYIKNNPNTDRVRLLSNAAEGLVYLHSRNVIHGDLKGRNILIDIVEGAPRARLADFGITIVTKNLNSMRSATEEHANTPRWAAPEVCNGKNPSKQTDIFSFGMVMVEVFTGQAPYSDKAPFAAVHAMLNGENPPRPAHTACTDLLWRLMNRCWDRNPSERPEASEVLHILSS